MKRNGLLFVRHVRNKSILVTVVDKIDLQEEAQHVFEGKFCDGVFYLKTMREVIDIKDTARGNTPDGLLCMPIWRT
jgi:hypothetical protein